MSDDTTKDLRGTIQVDEGQLQGPGDEGRPHECRGDAEHDARGRSRPAVSRPAVRASAGARRYARGALRAEAEDEGRRGDDLAP